VASRDCVKENRNRKRGLAWLHPRACNKIEMGTESKSGLY
jgi:hypothetical protein